jgi:hypothetical protein
MVQIAEELWDRDSQLEDGDRGFNKADRKVESSAGRERALAETHSKPEPNLEQQQGVTLHVESTNQQE